MKKSYSKPEIQVISYTLNEAIANTCGAQLYNHSSMETCDLMEPYDSMFDAGAFTFVMEEGCDTPLMDYCYVTAESIIFAS